MAVRETGRGSDVTLLLSGPLRDFHPGGNFGGFWPSFLTPAGKVQVNDVGGVEGEAVRSSVGVEEAGIARALGAGIENPRRVNKF